MFNAWTCTGNQETCRGECLGNTGPSTLFNAFEPAPEKLFPGALADGIVVDSTTPIQVHTGDSALAPEERTYATFLITVNQSGVKYTVEKRVDS